MILTSVLPSQTGLLPGPSMHTTLSGHQSVISLPSTRLILLHSSQGFWEASSWVSQCLYTQKVFSAGHSFPNRMLELYLFNLFSQKLKYFTNHNRCLSQHACLGPALCLLASGWPELQPLSWMVVAGSSGQQMKPAALVLLD